MAGGLFYRWSLQVKECGEFQAGLAYGQAAWPCRLVSGTRGRKRLALARSLPYQPVRMFDHRWFLQSQVKTPDIFALPVML